MPGQRLFLNRKIMKIGDSLGITLPSDMIKTYSLKEGDNVKIIFDSDIGSTLNDQYVFVIDLKGRSEEELWKILNRLFE